MKTLVTLLPSVDVDLGRWLMQKWQIAYTEKPHAPVFHVFALQRLGLGPEDYPALIDGDTTTAGIERLVAALDHLAPARLMPDKAAEPELYQEIFDFQHEIRYTMGSGVVNWAYFNLMKDKSLVKASFTTGVPFIEKLAFWFAFGWIRNKMTEGLKLSDKVAAEGLEAAHAGFDKVDAMLADGRQFLAGGKLTLADLAFSTTGAPMVMEPKYGGHLPGFDQLPVEMQTIVQGFRDRPAGKFIQRIYAEHRT